MDLGSNGLEATSNNFSIGEIVSDIEGGGNLANLRRRELRKTSVPLKHKVDFIHNLILSLLSRLLNFFEALTLIFNYIAGS